MSPILHMVGFEIIQIAEQLLCLQVKWELGSSIVGPLLRRYGPHDTYSVSFILGWVCKRASNYDMP